MIELPITPEILSSASQKSDEMGTLNNSITSGTGNLCGFIGEEIVCNLMSGTIQNTFDYDIIKNGCKFDVKTKRCTSQPQLYYECSIAAYNTRQNCDYYIFTRIEYIRSYTRAWVLGYYPKKQYYDDARSLKKGEIIDNNNFVVKADCYNMQIKDLFSLEFYREIA